MTSRRPIRGTLHTTEVLSENSTSTSEDNESEEFDYEMMEDTSEEEMNDEEMTGQYSVEDIEKGLNELCKYIRKRGTRDNYCLNINGETTGTCDCVYRVSNMEPGRETEKCHKQIAKWFSSTYTVEEESKQKKKAETRLSFLTNTYKKCVQARPYNNGKQYTKTVNFTVLPDKKKEFEAATWNGHNWDLEVLLRDAEDDTGNCITKMCVPSVLNLWRCLVGGPEWSNHGNAAMKTWNETNYPKVMVDAGVIAEQTWKQQTRQRLFYARLEDFMDSAVNDKNVGFRKAYQKYREMGWLDEGDGGDESSNKFCRTMAQNWYMWKLGTIHIIRSNSNMTYGKGTKELFDSLGMQVCSVKRTTCEFLEELFLYVTDNTPDKMIARVARDRKLRYLPFEMCVDIQSALENYYGDAGDGRLTGDLKYFVKDKSYKKT